MRLVPTTPRPATPRRSGFDIFSSLRLAENLISGEVSRVAARNQGRTAGLPVSFGSRLLLLLSLLARGVARVSLKLALVFKPLLLLSLALRFGLARERFEPQLLLARGLLDDATGGFSGLLFRLALGSLGVAHFPRLEDLFPLSLALDDRRIRWIIFRVGEKLLRHRLARIRGGSLAISKLVAVQKGHWFLVDWFVWDARS